ncbi:hypothetical protein [Baekduia sp. Peel2402]|uniref:hypothetical protein n=1 Tax=Baekduia sp. Peel2402 TaxID=3458296 RepID=UPI00403E58DD
MRLVSRLIVCLSLLAAAPASASAAISYTLDIKAHPSVFKANTVVDVPLYFVETRGAGDPVGITSGSTLRNVRADFYSSHSKFLGFTPVAAFDEDGCDLYCINKIQYVHTYQEGVKSSIYFNAQSKTGVPITLDNSGITGRTEVLMGTLKIQVGPVVEVAGHKVVLDVVFHDDPIGGNIIVPTVFTPDHGTHGLTNMVTKRIMVFNDDVVPEGTAPGDGGGTGGTGGGGSGGDGTGGTGGGGTGGGSGGGSGGTGGAGGGPTAGGGPAAGAGGPASGSGSPTSATAKACSTAKTKLRKATATVKSAKKLAAKRAQQAKSAPAAKRTAARKKAKQAQSALKQAQKAQTTAQRAVRTVC